MNVLHHIEEAATLISNLNALLTGERRLNLTSLVSNHRLVCRSYLRFLHASGDFVRPAAARNCDKCWFKRLAKR